MSQAPSPPAPAPKRGEAPNLETMAAEDAAATKVLTSLHRIASQSTLYAANNEAQRMALEAAVEAARDYGKLTGRNITIFFSERAVFVGKRLLRASRGIYATAAQMRELLATMGVSQITIGHDVPASDLRILQEAFGRAQKGTQSGPPAELKRIRLRVGRPPGDYAEFDTLSPEERAIKVYALAIVIVRRFYEDLQRGEMEINAHVRRISEELIALAETAEPMMLAATVCRPPNDDAERAVSAALLALVMAHQLTTDQRLLRWLATATLLCDVGKPRVAGLDPHGGKRGGLRMPRLGLDQFRELPGATAFVTTALGRLTDAGMMRSVLVYEALHIEHEDETDPIYGGERGPAMLSRLIACARRFQQGLAEGHASPDVVAGLVGKANGMVDRWIVQLLMATLNILPTGTVVELDNGLHACVVSPPASRVDFGCPIVRVVPKNGEPTEERYLDLSKRLDDGLPAPKVIGIVRAVDGQSTEIDPDAVPTTPPSRPDSAVQLAVAIPANPLPSSGERDDDIYIMVGNRADPGRSALKSVPPPPLNSPFSDMPPDSDRPPPPDAGDRASLTPHEKPKAHGSLGKTPLVHLLVYALDNKLDGTLLLLDGQRRRSAIYFKRGAPSKAQTADLVSPLDRTLLSMGLLDEETLAHTLHAVARAKRLHGQYLVRQGYLEPAQLRTALEQQLVDKLGYMMRLSPDTRYAYYEGVDMLADYGGAAMLPVDPLPLIMMAVRKYVEWDTIDGILPRIANTPLRLHPLANPERLGLKPPEEAVISIIRQRSLTINDMLAEEAVDEDATQRLVYALVITRCIDLSDQTRNPVGI